MDQYKFSGTSRPMDFNYQTNRLITLLTVIIFAGGIVYKLLTGTEVLDSLLWGLGVSAAFFLTWAITRETDPDNNLPAFLASFITLIALFKWYPPDFVALIWILVISRLVNRTSGVPAKITDGIFVTALSIWLTYKGYWVYAALGGFAFFMDAILPTRNRKQLVFAILHLLILVVVWLIGGRLTGIYLTERTTIYVFIGFTLLYLPVILTSTKIRSVSDKTGDPLFPARIKTVQIIALIVALEVSIWHGNQGFQAIIPVWASIIASAMFRYYLLVRGMPK